MEPVHTGVHGRVRARLRPRPLERTPTNPGTSPPVRFSSLHSAPLKALMPLALLALAVGAFGIGTTEFVMMGLLPDVADDLHISIPSAGHLVSAYALGVVIGAPLLAAATARMSRRKVLIALMGLFVAGNALSAFAPTTTGCSPPASSAVCRTAPSSASAPSSPPTSSPRAQGALRLADVPRPDRREHRGRPRRHLHRPALRLAGHLPRRERDRSGGDSLARVPHPARPHARPHGRPARRAGRPALAPRLAVLGTTVAGFGALFSAYSYITPMLTDSAGYADSSVTLLLALFGVGATVGNLVGGRLADRSCAAPSSADSSRWSRSSPSSPSS